MAKQIVSKDTPLAEITLRRYERPYNLNKRELVKKLCLSLGLLNPGDSRDVIVDILYVLLEARKGNSLLSSVEITEKAKERRKQEKLKLIGTANSNVRRQILRLRKLFIVEKARNKYRITENSLLTEAFSEKIEGYVLPVILQRIKDYMKAIDDEF